MTIQRGNAGRFLTTVLQGMKPQRCQRGGVSMAEYAEHATFFVKFVRKHLSAPWNQTSGTNQVF